MGEWNTLSELERDSLVAEKLFDIESNYLVNEDHYSTIPHYTADISAAWSVVDAIGVRPETEIYRPFHLHRNENGGYYAEFNLTNASGWAFADTAPEAICKAALRAVGVSV